MRRTRTATRTAVVLALGAVVAMGAGVANAAPPDNGCPSGYQLLSVADLAAQGYQVPGRVDDPNSGVLSFGQPGNGDGLVCAVQLGNRLTPWGDPIYNFTDNGLPAS